MVYHKWLIIKEHAYPSLTAIQSTHFSMVFRKWFINIDYTLCWLQHIEHILWLLDKKIDCIPFSLIARKHIHFPMTITSFSHKTWMITNLWLLFLDEWFGKKSWSWRPFWLRTAKTFRGNVIKCCLFVSYDFVSARFPILKTIDFLFISSAHVPPVLMRFIDMFYDVLMSHMCFKMCFTVFDRFSTATRFKFSKIKISAFFKKYCDLWQEFICNNK